jgi:hypothetical protein
MRQEHRTREQPTAAAQATSVAGPARLAPQTKPMAMMTPAAATAEEAVMVMVTAGTMVVAVLGRFLGGAVNGTRPTNRQTQRETQRA